MNTMNTMNSNNVAGIYKEIVQAWKDGSAAKDHWLLAQRT